MDMKFVLKKVMRGRGFTLIELMIAIAIIGVLAAIAIPQFTNYLARARVSEALNLAQSCRTSFVEFYSTRGTFPTSVAEAGCNSTPTENVASLNVTGGQNPRITVALANAAPIPEPIRGARIVLQPLDGGAATPTRADEGDVIGRWHCAALAQGGQNQIDAAGQPMIPSICNNPLVPCLT